MFQIKSGRSVIILFFVCVPCFIGPALANAATLTVDTLSDELNTNGSCSLREAITNINGGDQSGSSDCLAGDPAAADTISFSVAGTIVLAGVLPNITQDLTVEGPGAENLIISGNNSVRVVRVSAGVTAVIQNLTITSGFVSGTGGGGIYNQGDLTLSSCVISNSQDSGGAGGGIFNDGGGSILTINDSAISGNSSANGGGIYNFGTVFVERSTLSGNSATAWGGALYNNSNVSLTNVTISGNQADWGAVLTSGGTTTTYDNCTIVDNQATGPGYAAGIASNGASTNTLRNTILSNNTEPAGIYNCYQVNNSLGYNISNDGTCFVFTQPGDMQNTDPLLGPLQGNGGPTSTHALLAGSPAIDAGDPANCPATDQRGVARPADGNKDGNAVCDIGSYEMEKSSFPWTMFLPAFTQKQSKSVWRVLTMVSCDSPMTFTVTLEGTSRSSVMRPLIDFEGTYSDWASTTPGAKKFTWQATCPTYQTGWSGSVNKTLKDGMNYLLTLADGGGFPVVNVTERAGIPTGARAAAE